MLTVCHDSGGSVLSQLAASKYKQIAQCEIWGLVRGEGKANVLEQNGIKPQLHDSLDNTEELKEIASNFDSTFSVSFTQWLLIVALTSCCWLCAGLP